MKAIGFIGGGRITKIFLHAFENSGISLEKIVVSDINRETLDSLKLRFPKITVTTDNLQVVSKTEIVFLALHPAAIPDTLVKIKEVLNQDSVLVSLAPKITIEKLTAELGGFGNIARMNPSASTVVNKGVNPIAFAPEIKVELKDHLIGLMEKLGSTPIVEESKIEAYAVISAMGHTYFFFQLQKLSELAVNFGMDEKEAQGTITEMLRGTTETLFNSGLSYNVIDNLVPVKPLVEVEENIKGYYDQYLTAVFNKIRP